MSKITIVDIAKMSGVAVSTVSRVLNGHPDVGQKTRERILKVIKETGYVPNDSARNLKRTDAKCIGVLIKGITNPFFSPVIDIIEKEIDRQKYALILRHASADDDEADVALELENEKRLRGIIFLGGGAEQSADKLRQLKVPVVFSTIGSSVIDEKDMADFSTVSVDDRLEAKHITQYLMNLGHKDIAIITEAMGRRSVGHLRLEGYKDAFIERDMPVREDMIFYVDQNMEHFSIANGYRTTQRILSSGHKVTAVFCVTDLLAVGAMRAISDAGLRIPEDISVCGFDGMEIGRYYNPRLTTIKQPLDQISRETVKLLFDIIESRSSHRHIVFPGELSIGESTIKRYED
ncbi:MAG: LacI family transcriptional regulator [Butyrivibrio sp.]|nr:LacI family transcriptional regulator [Butyrivibrio sp.]